MKVIKKIERRIRQWRYDRNYKRLIIKWSKKCLTNYAVVINKYFNEYGVLESRYFFVKERVSTWRGDEWRNVKHTIAENEKIVTKFDTPEDAAEFIQILRQDYPIHKWVEAWDENI